MQASHSLRKATALISKPSTWPVAQYAAACATIPLAIHPVFVDLARRISGFGHDEEPQVFAAVLPAAQAAIDTLRLQRERGPFSHSWVLRPEKSIASLVQAALHASLTQRFPTLCVLRELAVHGTIGHGGFIDMALLHISPQGEVPLAVFELTKNDASTKAPQLFANANNALLKHQPPTVYGPLVGVILSQLGRELEAPQMCVKGYHFACADRLGEVALGQCPLTPESLAHLLVSLIKYADAFVDPPTAGLSESTLSRHLRKRFVFDRQRVFKVFDYRASSGAPLGTRRSAAGYQFLIGSRIERLDQRGELDIVWYQHIAGSHVPSRPEQVAQVVRHLHHMHSAGWCHGDIRAANLVFGESVSSIIDFDMSRCLTTDALRPVYCSNYNAAPGDVIRHENARANADMSQEHDRHALHSILAVLSDDERWHTAIAPLRTQEPLDSIAAVVESLNNEIVFRAMTFAQLRQRLDAIAFNANDDASSSCTGTRPQVLLPVATNDEANRQAQ